MSYHYNLPLLAHISQNIRKVALKYANREISYGTLRTWVIFLADLLLKLGVPRGQGVVIASTKNRPVCAMLACLVNRQPLHHD